MQKYFKYIKPFLVAFSLFGVAGLSGCTGMHSQFDCNTIGGIQSCVTLGHVNRMANKGDFERDSNGGSGIASTNSKLTSNNSHMGMFLKTPTAGEPLRYGETIQNVWIAPYQTKDGSYVWPSMVTIILHQGHWLGDPVSAIQKSGEV